MPKDTTQPIAALFGRTEKLSDVFARGRLDEIKRLTRLCSQTVTPQSIENDLLALHRECDLSELSVIFSTWGMPLLTDQQLDRMPNLRAVFYAAGAVQKFARPLLERHITVVSAWQANAIPVAEWTVAHIILSNKGFYRNTRSCNSPAAWKERVHGPGNYGETVALLGAGAIGRKVIELLRGYELKVIVFDPFLSDEDAKSLGVEKVSLQEAFKRGIVISNHLANKPATVGILNADLLNSLRRDATFINTGRGRTVNEDDLIEVFTHRSDLTALLDVTYPEPPTEDSQLFNLSNVHLTTHIAGSLGDELARMADVAIEEFLAWKDARPLRYAVTLEDLKHLA